jgi:cytoplasmic iron level regulating protein YaaA (DUF328/UPF0246 family)
MMCDYIIQHKIKKIKDLQGFNCDNYTFSAELSTARELVFVR